MNKMKEYLKDKSVGFYLLLTAAVVGFVCVIYYVIQSNMDDCFNVAFFLLVLFGIIAAVASQTVPVKYMDSLVPVAAILWGMAFGIMVNNMLPTMSDVWNGVNFIGGNLSAYIVYTVLAFITAVLGIVACFMGTQKTAK